MNMVSVLVRVVVVMLVVVEVEGPAGLLRSYLGGKSLASVLTSE